MKSGTDVKLILTPQERLRLEDAIHTIESLHVPAVSTVYEFREGDRIEINADTNVPFVSSEDEVDGERSPWYLVVKTGGRMMGPSIPRGVGRMYTFKERCLAEHYAGTEEAVNE